MKQCSLCCLVKDLIDFSPDKRRHDGVYSSCKKCCADKASHSRKESPEKYRASVRKSALKNYKNILNKNNLYRKNNPEKVTKWKKNDRKNNKVRILADNASRRSLLKNKNTVEILQMYALRDFYISMSLGEQFHVDHIIPLSKGGEHVIENLQVIPAIDNLRKSNSL